MALFDDARVDSADLADLVNGSGLVTTRYGDNPKKSWKYMENEFDTMLSTLQANGESQITVIVNDLESSGEAQLTTVLAGIQSDGDAAIENFTVNGERAIDDFNSDGASAINLFNTQAANDLSEFDQALDQYKESRGFNNKGTFADGFTYELPNDVGIDASGNPWIYNGTLPFTVTAGTAPTAPTYTQVAYGTAAQVSMNTSDTVQSFADSFALKIFQSPTDGWLTEIQTRTVNANEVYEVRNTSDDSLAAIYSDAAGTTEIVQDGTSNVSGSDGTIEFYIDDGDYYVEVDGVKSGFTTSLKTEFETVDEAKNYSGIEELLGNQVYLKDRLANFVVVLTSSVTPNGLGEIQSIVNPLYSFAISDKSDLYAHQLGFDSGDFVDLQPILDYCIERGLNLNVRKANYVMSAGVIRWPPTITVDFKGSYVLCEFGAKIKNQFIASDPTSENSYEGFREYIKNLRIEGAGRNVLESNVWFIGNEAGSEVIGVGKDFARCKSSGIQVVECNPGQDYGGYNTYILTHEDCMIERCATSIRTPANSTNSGENIKYTGTSIFSSADAVLECGAVFDFSFDGCSFDFVQDNVIKFVSGYNSVRFRGCYFEKSVTKGLATTTGAYDNMSVMVDDTVILPRQYTAYTHINANSANTKLFTGEGVDYFVSGLRLRKEIISALPDMYDLASDDIKSLTFSGYMPERNWQLQVLGPSYALNRNANLESSSVGDAIATGVVGFVDSGTGGRYNWKITDVESYSGSKSIEVTLGTNLFTEIRTQKIPISKSCPIVVVGCKLHGGTSTGVIKRQSKFRVFDIDGNLIETFENTGVDQAAQLYDNVNSPLYDGTRNYWVGMQSDNRIIKTAGAAFVDVTTVLSNFDGTVYIDDYCVNIY